jgi:hypothetical protein
VLAQHPPKFGFQIGMPMREVFATVKVPESLEVFHFHRHWGLILPRNRTVPFVASQLHEVRDTETVGLGIMPPATQPNPGMVIGGPELHALEHPIGQISPVIALSEIDASQVFDLEVDRKEVTSDEGPVELTGHPNHGSLLEFGAAFVTPSKQLYDVWKFSIILVDHL